MLKIGVEVEQQVGFSRSKRQEGLAGFTSWTAGGTHTDFFCSLLRFRRR